MLRLCGRRIGQKKPPEGGLEGRSLQPRGVALKGLAARLRTYSQERVRVRLPHCRAAAWSFPK